MQIHDYARAADLGEAYALLTKSQGNRLIGGCTFLRRTNTRIATAVDLQDCGLNYIHKTENAILLGAYTSLREIEISAIIHGSFGTMLSDPLEHLIGIQLRNQITIGAHVASRFGFSDIIPTLLAMNARVRFYHSGEMSLRSYMQLDRPERDILTEIVLPLEGRRGKVQMIRRSYSDYSIFCLAASCADGDWIVSAGVLPGRAKLAERTMEKMNSHKVARSDATALANEIAGEFKIGSNRYSSAEYRRELCRVFARRAIEELADED